MGREVDLGRDLSAFALAEIDVRYQAATPLGDRHLLVVDGAYTAR